MTLDPVNMTEGVGPNAIGGSKWMLCILDRATRCGFIGTVKSTASEGVVYHMRHAIVNYEVGMVYSDGGRESRMLALN